jgi:class 3 adenylate cyclase/tetratricopeptide (TPR) repeat protein
MRCPQCGLLNPDTARYCANCGEALGCSRQGKGAVIAPLPTEESAEQSPSGCRSAVSASTGQSALSPASPDGPLSVACQADAAGDRTRDELAAAREAVDRLRRYVPAVVAEGILHDQERLRGERREVAVLFADAVNFTHLSASLDAELVFNLINDLLSRLVVCVHRYGGLVDKFTGDGLMAVFGTPIAHENDSEMAVRAALDMQRAAVEFESIALAQLGAPLQVRIGVHTGPVVAGIIGTQEQAAYTVIGETVNLASRFESLAQPGHILVSSRVYQQTRALFNFQTMGTTYVKGLDQPVAVYEALGDRSQPLPTRGIAGVTDVFLGRDAELEQLRALCAAFLTDRRGRLVLVQGEAGMGKSRLVSEGLSPLGDRTASRRLPSASSDQADIGRASADIGRASADIGQASVTIWQGRGLPYAQSVAYGIFRSLLQDAVRARRSSPASPPGESSDTARPMALCPPWVSPALRPTIHQMMGQALTPEELAILRSLGPERVKQLTILAVREWILGAARQRPLALILEDFHWADDLSRDVLRTLGDLTNEAPVLLVVITRPQPEAPVDLGFLPPEKPLEAPLYLSLELKPFSPEQSRMLLAHLVDMSGMPDSLVSTILAHAEGNPFYVEEFVRMLIEKEVLTLGDGQWQVSSAVALQKLEIPTTLRGLMMARVDRLPEDLQNVLRSAAVIGLQFSVRLLEMVERRLYGPVNVSLLLERLVDLGLLEEHPRAGDQVYIFTHILAQETVYRSLLRSQRPGLHRTVAECIEDLHGAELTGQVEVLALHYNLARVRDKALHYSLLAGDRAYERFANREAVEYYSRALQLSQHLGDSQAERWRAAVGLGQVEQHIGEYEEAVACYRAALDEGGDARPEACARVMLRLGQVWEKRGELQEAEGWYHQGLAQIRVASVALPELQAQIYSELGVLSRRRGDLSAAQEWQEKALALVSDTEQYDVMSSILNRLGGVHYSRGDWDEATKCVQRALELRQRLGDVVGSARSLNNLGVLKYTSGDWDGAATDLDRAAELHGRIGEVEGLSLSHSNLGLLHTERGEWDQAEEHLRYSFAIAQRIAHPYELAQAHKNLGRLYLLQRRWGECAQHLKTAIPLYAEAGARANLNLSEVYYFLGVLDLEQGQIDSAQQWAERCHSLLQEIADADEGESTEWGRYEQLTGRIAQARGGLVIARHHLERSAGVFRASGSLIEVGRTAYWSGLLSLALQEPERAREEMTLAWQVFDQLGAAADLRRVAEQLVRLEEM